ncbi:hypothetical protein E4P42_18590 [Mycobacterium sp. PS03-16]|nr:hypothetical protein E4P42_18590 [Mycobacterium sp. PS03-16]
MSTPTDDLSKELRRDEAEDNAFFPSPYSLSQYTQPRTDSTVSRSTTSQISTPITGSTPSVNIRCRLCRGRGRPRAARVVGTSHQVACLTSCLKTRALRIRHPPAGPLGIAARILTFMSHWTSGGHLS